MKAKMCTPCEKRFEDYLQTHGKTLRARTIAPVQSRKKDEKVTCIICGRKRFGANRYDSRAQLDHSRQRAFFAFLTMQFAAMLDCFYRIFQ